MKELREILDRVDRIAPNERAILATVVDVKGSGYRLAGARMLIDESGSAIGSVSGGCLETDVLERAKNVLTNRRPTIVVYDSTKDDNSVFGLQMGCRGVVRILLEPANDQQPIKAGEVTIDLFHRSVFRGGKPIHLTPKEFAVLGELARHRGRVLSHEHLLRTAWGPAQESQTEYLRVAIRALRQKLESNPKHPAIILNEPAVGYRLAAV